MELIVRKTATSLNPAKLFEALREKADELRLSPAEFAGRLQLAYTYWRALHEGKRSVAGFATAKMDDVVALLKLPTEQIAALAGIVFPEQLLRSLSVEDQLDLVLERMRSDPIWAPFAPRDDEWRDTPTRVKIALALIYEQLFQRVLSDRAPAEPMPTKVRKRKTRRR
jgi:hypothetical protein